MVVPKREPKGLKVETLEEAKLRIASMAENQLEHRISLVAQREIFKSDTKVALSEALKAKEEGDSIRLVGDDKAKEADDRFKSATGKAALSLFRFRISGGSAAEASDMLGSAFGFATKKDGSPSKTPANGPGLEIRKRVERLTDAYEVVHGRNPGSSLQVIIKADMVDDLQQEVDGVMDGGSLFTAADAIDKLVKAAKEPPVPLHMSPDKLRKLIENMADMEVIHAYATNPMLRDAYAELSGAIEAISKAGLDMAKTLHNQEAKAA